MTKIRYTYINMSNFMEFDFSLELVIDENALKYFKIAFFRTTTVGSFCNENYENMKFCMCKMFTFMTKVKQKWPVVCRYLRSNWCKVHYLAHFEWLQN